MKEFNNLKEIIMSCECRCQCSCHKTETSFSKMPKVEQEKLMRDACYGLSRKLLNKEALRHRETLDQALALDALKRRRAEKAFADFDANFYPR